MFSYNLFLNIEISFSLPSPTYNTQSLTQIQKIFIGITLLLNLSVQNAEGSVKQREGIPSSR